jgi:hypothetical protein
VHRSDKTVSRFSGDRKSRYETARVTGAWCARTPLVPRTVSVNVPRAVRVVVFTVSVEVPRALTEDGVKVAVAPEGSPLKDSATVPVKPTGEETVIVYAVELPRLTVLDAGLTERAKSGVEGLTTRVTEVECVSPPPLPVIVSG